MRRTATVLLVAAALALGACGVPIHRDPTVVPKDKVPFHLSDPGTPAPPSSR